MIDARLVVQGIEKRTMKITASNDPHRLSRRHWAAGRTDEHSTEYKGPYQVDTHPDIYDTGCSLLSTVQQMTFLPGQTKFRIRILSEMQATGNQRAWISRAEVGQTASDDTCVMYSVRPNHRYL
ncbi:hypothetical protein CIHG_08911 [Coccidioides immitis H538.4]|uniref:Uncharacterized protein n=1 Tax=Coccidioides immitis H538.4 TaxID=396776 RepID=A0A0J8S1Z3_COCIT|nr:hypothetical protein CIHG_08911 [Coccidioides immitis H538.4]